MSKSIAFIPLRVERKQGNLVETSLPYMKERYFIECSKIGNKENIIISRKSLERGILFSISWSHMAYN